MTRPRPQISLDMLRAFVCLAETLNLSRASEVLGVTRQTLRRNIDHLETLRGERLFELDQGRYRLSAAGETRLSDAREILTWCDSWDSTNRFAIRRLDGYEHARYAGPGGEVFHTQQHSLASIASSGSVLLRRALAAWGTSLARVDDPAWSELQPYRVVYRRTGTSWIFAEVGARSAYTLWFGEEAARSAVGTLFHEDNVGDEFNDFIARAYSEVHAGGGMRLDHVYATLPWQGGELRPVGFQRLLAGCAFPDGSPALMMIAAITDRLQIDSLPENALGEIPGPTFMASELSDVSAI